MYAIKARGGSGDTFTLFLLLNDAVHLLGCTVQTFRS